MAECQVTVSGHPDGSRRNRVSVEGKSVDVDAVVNPTSAPRLLSSRLLACGAESSFLIIFGDQSERDIVGSVILGFCDEWTIASQPETFTRFNIIFSDSGVEDAVQFECDRVSDVEGLLNENQSASLVSIIVTRTSAGADTFVFNEKRLTVLFTTHDKASEVAKNVDSISHQLRMSPKSIICHFQESQKRFKAITECLAFRSECPTETFGFSDSPSMSSRLQDVRSWSYKINEMTRFSPTTPGAYFINLNPNLVVGEKLAHYIVPGISLIVGKPSDGSVFDFCLTRNEEFESVWSPHCRIRCEDKRTFLRPECGLTFINGQLLSDEREVLPNDRVALGTEVLLRYVVVDKERRVKGKHIVDFETAAREFAATEARVTTDEPKEDTAALEIQRLQDQLHSRSAGGCLVLTNPPESHQETNIWSLEEFEIGEPFFLGSSGSIVVPSLKTRATLVKEREAYLLTMGTTTKKLFHGSRFVVGDLLFLINDTERKKSGGSLAEKSVVRNGDAPASTAAPFFVPPAALLDLRNELFDLQWSVSSLFDFAFPIESAASDAHQKRRRNLADDQTITAEKYSYPQLSSTLKLLTETVQMIGSAVSEELNHSGEDVNGSLLRVLHDRNRTIEQLLLSTDSFAPVAWKQLEKLQLSLGQKLITLEKLEFELGVRLNQNCGENKLEAKSCAEAVAAAHQAAHGQSQHSTGSSPPATLLLKAAVLIPTPIIARRFASTVESLARTSNVRLLWDRYCRDLDSLLESSGGAHNVQPSKHQSVVLALLDVLLAFEAGVRHGWIVQGDRSYVERRQPAWSVVVDQCIGSFSKSVVTCGALDKRPVLLQRPNVSQSPRGSRQPSPSSRQNSPMARTNSKERIFFPPASSNAPAKDPSPLKRIAGRTPSPLQQRSTLGTSPASLKTQIGAVPTPRSTTSGRLTARSELGGPRPTTATLTSRPRDISPATMRLTSKKTTPSTLVSSFSSARAPSPKTSLTRQLIDLELGLKRRI